MRNLRVLLTLLVALGLLAGPVALAAHTHEHGPGHSHGTSKGDGKCGLCVLRQATIEGEVVPASLSLILVSALVPPPVSCASPRGGTSLHPVSRGPPVVLL